MTEERDSIVQASMLIAGRALPGRGDRITIYSPYRGEPVGETAEATPEEIEDALASASAAARDAELHVGGRRAAVLERVAALVETEVDEFARLIALEQGKTIGEARKEAGRVPLLLRVCAGEARRLGGETVPLDQGDDGIGCLGLTVRIPVGVVVAITPFNYPLLLVAHKLGPAFAAGNAVILKPATVTPLSGLRLAQLFAEAGAPEGSVQCVTGSGAGVGMSLVRDPRVRAVTFTGSEPVGRAIAASAGVKRLLLELGANCPLIVAADANIEQAAAATAVGGYSNAGQACISAQRVLVQREVYGDFLDALIERVAAIKAGDPLDETSTMGPLISEQEAERVTSAITEATALGAKILQGGHRDGSLVAPTVVSDVSPDSSLFSEELFGPAVGVTSVNSLDEAIVLANRSEFGLGAGIFTENVHNALRFVREVEAGVLQVNWSPLWRADSMPYGGLKGSGIGKEGPRWAIEELTELKTVVFHPPAT
ncbi:aldehyde dehydrogenase family protein [Candidatus Protofrankia californiensis]|uniref:aldehyde dehydrogenase family protein n=1 Tax=Candidatus Protofrankia californiensis TaxID=1839754 RepID=UPI0019D2E651|nr:aldehyde dehydrogenase family protein [Candidatus Protofrankia californiensis]